MTERKIGGGLSRGKLRHRIYEEATQRVDRELKAYKFGEPSLAFFPKADGETATDAFTLMSDTEVVISQPQQQVVFDVSIQSGVVIGEADRAKTQADAINQLLLVPVKHGRIDKGTLNFLRGQFRRSRRYARTLINKDQPVAPAIRRYLKV